MKPLTDKQKRAALFLDEVRTRAERHADLLDPERRRDYGRNPAANRALYSDPRLAAWLGEVNGHGR